MVAPKRAHRLRLTVPWRHALQDFEPLIGFVNLRPKDPLEFEEAIAHLTAGPAPSSRQVHSHASLALLKALGGTALNAPLRMADVILVDRKRERWQDSNAERRALQFILHFHDCTVRILGRLARGNGLIVNGVERPELDPKTQRVDFVANSRDPIDMMTFGPTPHFQLPVVYDIQDALFLKIRSLIDRAQRPVRLRRENGTIVPTWPLASCLVCGCFYFKSRADRATCSRRCTQRWDHIRRQRTVRDSKTGKSLRQHDLQVTATVVRKK